MVRCVRDVCQGSARYSTAATVFFVNAATFGRYNAYARRSLVQLNLGLCAFFGLLVSYWTLASGSTSTTIAVAQRPCCFEVLLN